MKTIKSAPNYKINKNGEIFNIKRNKIVKPYVDQLGYYQITLKVNKKSKHFRVHRLMAEAFLYNNDNLDLFVNHIDGNKLNNKLSNLELCTNQQNVKHAYDNGLYKNKKRSNKVNIDGIEYKSIRDASNTLNINRKRLTGILQKRIPNHTNFNIIEYVLESVETTGDECSQVE